MMKKIGLLADSFLDNRLADQTGVKFMSRLCRLAESAFRPKGQNDQMPDFYFRQNPISSTTTFHFETFWTQNFKKVPQGGGGKKPTQKNPSRSASRVG